LCRGIEVSTGSGSDWVAIELVVIKVRQLIALRIKHIVNRTCDAALIPQISLAALFGPWAVVLSPTSIMPHLPGGVCFECCECTFRLYRSD